MGDTKAKEEKDVNETESQEASENVCSTADAVANAKSESFKDMKKTLPDWSLEPPATFLS